MYSTKNDYLHMPLSPKRPNYSLKTDDIPGKQNYLSFKII